MFLLHFSLPRSHTANPNTAAPLRRPAARAERRHPSPGARLPGHGLRDGPRAHRHLDPFLPLLSPGICQHIVLIRVQLVGVMQLHGGDQVCPKHLERERKDHCHWIFAFLFRALPACRVTMELPCNKVTVSTETQSDLLQETPRPAPPWASLRAGGGSSSPALPPSLASSERRQRLHQLPQHRSLAVVPGKIF